MGWLYWLLGIAVLLIGVIVLWVFVVRSSFSAMTYECEDAYTAVDLFLKKRYDIISQVVETVQQYAAHETAAIEALIELRNDALSSTCLEEACNKEAKLTEGFRRLFEAADKYQPLRISAVFMSQKSELRAIEQDITNAGEQYKRRARRYNKYYDKPYCNIIATLFRLRKMATFEMPLSIEE